MPNLMLRLAFVGTKYSGWQIQPDVPTVQGTLKEVLERILGHEVRITGCCRTDAGVHAKDYVANFFTEKDLEEDKLLRALNSLLPKDIGVYEVRRVSDSFNSRFSVKKKVYAYRIWNSQVRDPFLYPFVWQVPRRLNLSAVEESINILSGVHDFSGFAKLEEEKNTVIDLKIGMSVEGNLVVLTFEASHFLRYMVRRITGALVKVGGGRLNTEDVRDFLRGRNCPYTAPAKGLTLERVIL